MKRFLIIFPAIFLFLVNSLNSSPINTLKHRDEVRKHLRSYNSEKLISFMQKYGYLKEPVSLHEGLKSEFLYAEDSIIDGIKKIQKFGGLDQTGILDETTINLMNSPRCGVKDVLNASERHKRYIVGAENWRKRKITYFIANWSYKVGQNETYVAIEKAFEAWSLYSRLVFKRIFDNTADIIIAFGSGYHGDRYPFDGPGQILAHAFYPYEENNFGGDIHFDNDENWKEGSNSLVDGVDFLTVAVHEIGHSLGLAHSFVYNSIMFPYYKGVAAQLEYDDILGMYQLYISKTLEENTDEDDKKQNSETTQKIETTEEEEEEKDEEEKEKEAEVSEVDDNEITSAEESTTPIPIPDLCDGNFDAAGLISNFLYIIKGNFIWQLDQTFSILPNFPKTLQQVFPNLPRRFKKIDAFYHSLENDEIVFFSGDEYITYDQRGPIFMAYNLTRYTYDPDIKRIDAAMVWAKNNKTYLFAGDRYWRFSETRTMDFFYPRIIKTWRGVPGSLDGAVSFQNGGPTAFFNKDEVLLYDNFKVKPKNGFPKKIREFLPSCGEDFES